MAYNPNIHKRRSIRLKNYDYSQAGLYFVTICCQDRACLFGKIDNDEMILNDAGKMIEKWYYELENKFSDIQCDAMIVMPNHIHCIIKNTGTDTTAVTNVTNVGADLRVCPNNTGNPDVLDNSDVLGKQSAFILGNTDILGEQLTHDKGEHIGSPLPRVVQWFKTMTTNEYIRGVNKTLGWKPFNGKLWQRNYYEHIIRDEQSYQTICNYITNNPIKWQNDEFCNITKEHK